MKLRDWYKFNFENDDFSANIFDFYVKVLRNPSPKSDEHIFTQLMRADDMISIFGDYNLYAIGKAEDDNYTTIKVVIYKSDESTHAEDNKTEEITLNMSYIYKGSNNSTVTVKRNKNGFISVITECGEEVGSYGLGSTALAALTGLANNEYK